MLRLPRDPNDGEPVRAADFRLLLRAIRSILPASSSTVRVQTGGSHTTFHVTPETLRAAAVANPTPYQVADASDATAPKVTVRPGTHNDFMPQIDGSPLVPPATTPPTPAPVLTLGAEATYVYVQFDFVYDVNNKITITDGKINSANSDVPTSTLVPGGGGGTGSFYEALSAVTVTAPTGAGGSYSVKVDPLVTSIRTFYICGGALVAVTS